MFVFWTGLTNDTADVAGAQLHDLADHGEESLVLFRTADGNAHGAFDLARYRDSARLSAAVDFAGEVTWILDTDQNPAP